MEDEESTTDIGEMEGSHPTSPRPQSAGPPQTPNQGRQAQGFSWHHTQSGGKYAYGHIEWTNLNWALH